MIKSITSNIYQKRLLNLCFLKKSASDAKKTLAFLWFWHEKLKKKPKNFKLHLTDLKSSVKSVYITFPNYSMLIYRPWILLTEFSVIKIPGGILLSPQLVLSNCNVLQSLNRKNY